MAIEVETIAVAATKVSIPCSRRKGSERSLKVYLSGPGRRGSRQSLAISSYARTAAKSQARVLLPHNSDICAILLYGNYSPAVRWHIP